MPSLGNWAKEIKHDTIKKQLTYKDALLKVYDVPVLYFPKFFHPDPTVERQSGLKTVLNKSNVLGTSYIIPYYVISDVSDITATHKYLKIVQKWFKTNIERLEKIMTF